MRMTLSPVEGDRDSEASRDVEAPAETGGRHGDVAAVHSVGALREQLVSEIESMARFMLSDGTKVKASTASALERLERAADLPLSHLIALHNELAVLCPAKPRAVAALYQGQKTGIVGSLLGPTPIVRRLSVTSMVFALIFFATSLSGEVNVDTMTKSIYELSGTPLAIKLVLIMSAAGLGASFAVLFDVWDDLATNRFDPISESAHWMRIGLGVVAGLILAEIVNSEGVLTEGRLDADQPVLPLISEPLLALIGGFSATVLHMVMTSIVDAFRRAFGGGQGGQGLDERSLDALAGRLRNAASTGGEAPRTLSGTTDQVGPQIGPQIGPKIGPKRRDEPVAE